MDVDWLSRPVGWRADALGLRDEPDMARIIGGRRTGFRGVQDIAGVWRGMCVGLLWACLVVEGRGMRRGGEYLCGGGAKAR